MVGKRKARGGRGWRREGKEKERRGNRVGGRLLPGFIERGKEASVAPVWPWSCTLRAPCTEEDDNRGEGGGLGWLWAQERGGNKERWARRCPTGLLGIFRDFPNFGIRKRVEEKKKERGKRKRGKVANKN